MNIALDYDNTYTEDPTLWNCLIRLANSRGHSISIVTGRSTGNEPADLPPGTNIVYCNHKPKRQEASRQGHDFDVWIDDSPENIGTPTGRS